MEPLDDFAPYTVALGNDTPALKECMRNKQWEEAHKIAARMMSCLSRVNAYALKAQAEDAQKERELR
jgi:hypothetical protein